MLFKIHTCRHEWTCAAVLQLERKWLHTTRRERPPPPHAEDSNGPRKKIGENARLSELRAELPQFTIG